MVGILVGIVYCFINELKYKGECVCWLRAEKDMDFQKFPNNFNKSPKRWGYSPSSIPPFCPSLKYTYNKSSCVKYKYIMLHICALAEKKYRSEIRQKNNKLFISGIRNIIFKDTFWFSLKPQILWYILSSHSGKLCCKKIGNAFIVLSFHIWGYHSSIHLVPFPRFFLAQTIDLMVWS